MRAAQISVENRTRVRVERATVSLPERGGCGVRPLPAGGQRCARWHHRTSKCDPALIRHGTSSAMDSPAQRLPWTEL
jgi:hypothetical protein